VTARAHRGLNHLHLASTKFRRLKTGRYLIKVPVPNRQKPLLAALVITTGHGVAPIHQATSLAKRCSKPASSSTASSSGGAGARSSTTTTPRPDPTPTPSRAAHHHGLGAFTGGVPKALGTAGKRTAQVAASGARSAIFGGYIWALVVYFILGTLMLIVIGAVLQALRA
jgi:hypothetical protein